MEFALFSATAFGLGAFHSLEPGHGKTVIAAYLVGSRGTAWQAVLLGLVVAITHTSSVIVLGIGSLFAVSFWPDFASSMVLGIISGTAIIIIGLWMLTSRLKDMSRRKRETQLHDEHSHSHHHPHLHSHDHHHHELDPGEERRSLFQIMVLGVSGGLVPCPAALVVLLASLRSGEIATGLTYLLLFSLGVAATLVALGLTVSKATRFAGRYLDKPGLAAFTSIGSAVLITGLGAFVIWQAVAG